MLTKLKTLWALLDYITLEGNNIIINAPGDVLATAKGSFLKVASDVIVEKARLKIDQPNGLVSIYKTTPKQVIHLGIKDIVDQLIAQNVAIPLELATLTVLDEPLRQQIAMHNSKVKSLPVVKKKGCCHE